MYGGLKENKSAYLLMFIGMKVENSVPADGGL